MSQYQSPTALPAHKAFFRSNMVVGAGLMLFAGAIWAFSVYKTRPESFEEPKAKKLH
ncbi:hypothetical protein BJ742DRAFT_772393 [Cladochytrium replicatum]|nr:hypothetical protein BJ742DRAFT_772393 [Cladochytrium replicatum]